MKFRKVLLISGLMLPFSLVYADKDAKTLLDVQKPSVFETVSYAPVVYLSGYGGDTFVGQADVLMPMYFTNRNIFFGYLQSRMSDTEESWGDNPWSASLGFGYRQIVNDKALLGLYAFGDYSHTQTDHDIRVISPGAEAIGRVWEARINGYFPVSDKSWEHGDWADNYGDYHWNYFTGHEQYDHWYAYREETGNGGDVEIGRKLFKYQGVLVKGYVGGYYYNMDENDDITGGSLKLSAQPNRALTFTAQDTYDDTNNNTFMLGVKVKLNDLFKVNKENMSVDEDDLTRRLVDSIDRNIVANGNGALAPTNIQMHDKGQSLEKDNVWFFDDEKTTTGDGTYENPYNAAQYTQETIDNINNTDPEYAYMYFDGGDGGYSSASTIELYDSQSMWGRTEDYKAPAAADDLPVIYGQLELPGNNIIDSLAIQNIAGTTEMAGDSEYGLFDAGILIDGSNVTLSNDIVGANDNAIGYQTGIIIGDNIQNTKIINSNVYAYRQGELIFTDTSAADDVELNAVGIMMGQNSSLTIDHSNIYATADVLLQTSYNFTIAENAGNAIGVQAAGVFDNITVKDSVIAAESNVDLESSVAQPFLIYSDIGNSAGISLGTPLYISDATTSQTAGGDFSVHDNVVNVESSAINASSAINETDAYIYAISSGNSYGISMGNGEISQGSSPGLTGSSDDTNYDDSIYNNAVNVTASTFNISASMDYAAAYAINIGNAAITQYVDGSADDSIHDNDIVAVNNDFNVTADYHASYAYGINIGNKSIDQTINAGNVDNSISNNSIESTANDFDILATVSGDYYSADVYGISIGNNYSRELSTNVNEPVNSSASSADYSFDNSIYNNCILATGNIFDEQVNVGSAFGINIGASSTIGQYGSLNSNLSINDSIYNNSISSLNNVFNILSTSNNAYGINVGNLYIDQQLESTGNASAMQNLDNSIHDNTVTAINNSFNVTGGNSAYGINLGNNDVELDISGSVPFEVTVNTNVNDSIYSNAVLSSVNHFVITSESGSAYGIDVGSVQIEQYYDIYWIDGGDFYYDSDSSVYSNSIETVHDKFDITAGGDNSAYGVNIGNANVVQTIYAASYTGNGSVDVAIRDDVYNNEISAVHDEFNVTTTGQGNAYGINISAPANDPLIAASNVNLTSTLTKDIYNNEINAIDNTFDITATGSGSAYGISLGENGGFNNALEKNAIYAACNDFNIGAASGDSWGIWVFQGAGGVETTTLNDDAGVVNSFTLTQGTGGSGAKILWPNGDVLSW